jgi:hypothetical protein
MTVSRSGHHTTSGDVAQTILVYEKDAEIFFKQWGRQRSKRPLLLAGWLTLCGAGLDARYLVKRGHRDIGLDRIILLLQFAKRRALSAPFLLVDMRLLRAGSWTASRRQRH